MRDGRQGLRDEDRNDGREKLRKGKKRMVMEGQRQEARAWENSRWLMG